MWDSVPSIEVWLVVTGFLEKKAPRCFCLAEIRGLSAVAFHSPPQAMKGWKWSRLGWNPGLEARPLRGRSPTAESRKLVSGGKKADCFREAVCYVSQRRNKADLVFQHGELWGESFRAAAEIASAQRNVLESREHPADHAQLPGACFS